MHDSMTNYFPLKQQQYESNDGYLTRSKSMVETLKIAGGEHIFVSKAMLKKDISMATKAEVNAEREKFMAITFILGSTSNRFKKLCKDLKSAANRGRDEYPVTLMEAFNLLVRESGEYDTVRHHHNNPFHRNQMMTTLLDPSRW